MQKIHVTSVQTPTRKANYLGQFPPRCLAISDSPEWIVTSYDPETDKWENGKTPERWTLYPVDDGDKRFG